MKATGSPVAVWEGSQIKLFRKLFSIFSFLKWPPLKNSGQTPKRFLFWRGYSGVPSDLPPPLGKSREVPVVRVQSAYCTFDNSRLKFCHFDILHSIFCVFDILSFDIMSLRYFVFRYLVFRYVVFRYFVCRYFVFRYFVFSIFCF